MGESALVTGASGGLGQVLLPLLLERGCQVSALYRSSHPEIPGVEWVRGDVNAPNLGIEERKWSFQRCYHLAGLVSLNDADRAQLLKVNSRGTWEVVNFCQRNRIPRLFHVSTAYVAGIEEGKPPRNAYELSKWWAEQYVREATYDPGKLCRKFRFPIRATIFRPSILVPNPGLRVPPQGFLQYVFFMAQVHRRAEIVRRRLEGALRLPPLEPRLRILGDRHATLNLVSTGEVAEAIARDDGEPQGVTVRWLTHPHPPTFAQIGEWLGRVLMLRIDFQKRFSPSPPEALLQRLTRPFSPYLWGADLPSDIPTSEVDESFITRAVEELFREPKKD